MTTYIALLRGINVSGQKKVPMAVLTLAMQELGLLNVKTYINSGNVVFQTVKTNQNQLEELIKNKLFSYFGFEVSVLVKTCKQLDVILSKAPFSDEITEQSYFTLLHKKPDKNLVEDIKDVTYHNEEFYITEECVYFYSAVGYGRAKCNNNFFERKLKVTATTRNYKTMVKLLSLCSD
ncbi:DUF1697 domain-containing protein [Yeosuana marina]|uniref:DUF1697 domain-containing protein n=1 Tax=Yeosuana marina TaxID=1565536 RepID=UPI0030ED033F|tara:strand:+ start:10816 stop:11349 length:534 start_codon:yes stop_codon:yes gene_type:complete